MEQHDDDRPVGSVLTRREMLALLGGAGAGLVAGSGFARLDLSALAATPTGTASPSPAATGTPLPSCVVRPALTEGPYFVDEMLNRSDIRVESSDGSLMEGVPLALTFVVSDVSNPTSAPRSKARRSMSGTVTRWAYTPTSRIAASIRPARPGCVVTSSPIAMA